MDLLGKISPVFLQGGAEIAWHLDADPERERGDPFGMRSCEIYSVLLMLILHRTVSRWSPPLLFALLDQTTQMARCLRVDSGQVPTMVTPFWNRSMPLI